MFPQPILAPWARLFASLALEVILVFALTALLARLIRPASGQRMVWRVSFVVIAALVLAEFSGLGHSLLQNLRTSTPATPPPPQHTLVTTVVTTDTLAAPAWAPPVGNVPVVPAVNRHENPWSTLALWLPGFALAGLVWLVLRRGFGALKLIRLERQGLADAGDLAARVQALGRRLGIRRRVRVKSLPGLSSPIAFGMFRPTVGVPGDFSIRFTAAQQDAMLAHELAHVAAFDAVWMLLADLVTALLWWHPGAWWARRQLRAASETAADEASLLLEDGPATLAECLVTLGDLLTRSPDPGGLGMAGFRFRSELGRRVERLLHLRDGARHPWHGTSAWLARLLVPAALLAMALAFTAWLLPPAASAASIGEAFQGSPLGLATTALLTADKHDAPGPTYKGKQLHDLERAREADVRTLLFLGKKIYDAGSTNEAEATWRKVLELEPGNKEALDYLKRIGRTEAAAPKPAPSHLATRPITHTNISYTSNARQKIYQRLNSIRLESVKFDGVPLTQALEQIRKEAKRRDPDQKGINIIVSSTADPQAAVPAIDPATGLPVAGAVAGVEADISATTVTINPELNDVTLGQMLDILVKVANRPIRYSVEDYGVLFTSGGPGNPPLHTRWYKIDPNTFLHGLKGAIGPDERWRDFEKWLEATSGRVMKSADFKGGVDFLTVQTPHEIVTSTVRAYLQAAGVALDPPKKLFFNDRLGMLMVRATLQDHDFIERAIHPDVIQRHDRVEEAAQARTAGIPATNDGGTPKERSKTLSPAPKPLPGASVEVRVAPPPELHTRWFKIDPNTFLHGLQGFMAQDSIRSKDRGKAAGTVQTSEEIVSVTLRTFFQTIGVTLDPPKSMVFADRRGMLMVRATLEDLDLIEQAVQVLNTPPPQVVIEVKFCEVPEESFKALGFDFLLGSVASGPTGAPAERRQNSDSSQSGADTNHRNALTNASSDVLTGILTPQQYAVVLRAMEQRQGVNILATPRVTTPTGRQAQMKKVEVRTIVTGLDLTTNATADRGQSAEHPLITEQIELGPVVDVVPYVTADGRTIQMTVIPSIKEFLGYDKDEAFSKRIWDYVPSSGANPPPGSQLYPLPIFRLRQIVSSLTIWDGQTIVLASRTARTGVPESHIANKLPKELTEHLTANIQRMQKSPPKTMVVFITPTIVDPAGNRVHTDADIPERNSSIPAQPPAPRAQ